MKRFFTLIIILLAAISMARADGLDDQYFQIFNLIQEADSLSKNQPSQALAKYLAAQTALQRLKSGSPEWNSKVVGFRLSYVSAKIAALSAKAPAPSETSATSTNNTVAPGRPSQLAPADSAAQVAALNDQVRQLQAERVIMEAKLKEALAVAPAESDPRELARAEEKMKTLQKENDLLKLNAEKAKGSAAPVTPAKPSENAQPQVVELQHRLAEQQALASKLLSEKQALEARAKTSQPDSKELASLRSENELLKKQVASSKAGAASAAKTPDAAGQLAQAQAQVAALQSDKELLRLQLTALENRVKQLSATTPAPARVVAAPAEAPRTEAPAPATAPDAGRLKRLERERDDLQKQLALAKRELSNSARSAEAAASQNSEHIKQLETQRDDLQKQLALAKMEVSNTTHTATTPASPAQTDSRIQELERERNDLKAQLAMAKALPAPAATVAPATPVPDSSRIKQLERERDDLQKQLEVANKELHGRKSKTANNAQVDLQNQLAAARARLEVFEARQVPYSAEEQALFKQPATQLAQAPASPSKKPNKELPAGTAQQVAEAQRYFAAHQYDKAEQAYMQVLKHDEKNVLALANLAAIQVEAQHFEGAEANIKKALAIDPDDAYSLYVLGILQVRQRKFDQALDALSRAAKLDPQNPEIQNYLGLALSEKGLRGPAETALRKAVELQPTYGSAHYNLAVFYLSQQPAYPALARWHYQKAVAAGHPSNAEVEKRLDTKQ